LLAVRDSFFAADTSTQVQRINSLVSRYFGLTEDEAAIVEEGVRKIIPSTQPRRSVETPLLREVTNPEQLQYAQTLIAALERWQHRGTRLQATLLGERSPWRAIQLRFINPSAAVEPIVVSQDSDALLDTIHLFMSSLPAHRTRNFYFTSNLKVFAGDSLLLVKPLEARFWLRTAALNDADEIAGDLLMERHSQAMSHSHSHQ